MNDAVFGIRNKNLSVSILLLLCHECEGPLHMRYDDWHLLNTRILKESPLTNLLSLFFTPLSNIYVSKENIV